MAVEFTAHNIRLDDGSYTRPGDASSMEQRPWFLAARRVLQTAFPGDKSRYRVADLGCLEGGFSVELARLGFQVLGIDVREANIAACEHVKARCNLPNLSFVRDDVWNLAKHGRFDAVFCCGLLYHLDRPRTFLQMVADVTDRVLILHTHFSSGAPSGAVARGLRALLDRIPTGRRGAAGKYKLSELVDHDGTRGRWYVEFANDAELAKREGLRWASWDNLRSFWVQKEHLIQTIADIGFDLVLEQYDHLGRDIAAELSSGYYPNEGRGMFVGIKTGVREVAPAK